jgi:hippurate hydrolase
MRSIAAGFGVDVNVEFSAASKVFINTPANVDRVKAVVAEAFGQDRYEHMDQPIPGGEDYASILEVIPGAFVFLGAPDPTAEPQNLHANHSNKAVYDDSVLADGAALLAILAFDALSS